jgi:hypothetical protein
MSKFKVSNAMRKEKSRSMREAMQATGNWKMDFNQVLISDYSTRGGSFGTTFVNKSRTLQGYSKRWGR